MVGFALGKVKEMLGLDVVMEVLEVEIDPVARAVESISRKDPHKVAIMFFSFKSLYHPGMCLGTTRDHSRAPGAPGGHSKCTFFAFFGPGRAIIRSRAAKTLDSNPDTTTHRTPFVSSGHG